MLILRCTAKLLSRLKVPVATAPPSSTTRLGDWYATILIWRPAHRVLLVNELTRLAVVLPARELSTLAQRIPDAVARVLLDIGVEPGVVEEERRAMAEISFAKTASRSVLGTMNEHVFFLEHLRESEPNLTDNALSMWLGKTLVTIPPLGYEIPAEMAGKALARSGGEPRRSDTAMREGPLVKSTASVYELKITLRDIEPPIWRRLRVRSDITLFKLHGILQATMGWTDSHLHQFVAGGKSYGAPDLEFPARENEKKALVSQVLHAPNDSLEYEYDFGDGWKHDVVLEKVLDGDAGAESPRVIAGERACPPEDCGGPYAYADLLKVLANARHPEHREMLDWVGGSFDPEAFDVAEINLSRPLSPAVKPCAG